MALSSLFVEIGGSIAGLRTAMGGAVKEIKAVERATGETATGMERTSRMGGAAMAVLGVGVAAVGVKSLEMAADWQTGMTRLVTGAGESSGAIDKLSSDALDMAGKFGISTKDITAGLFQVESANFHGADATKVFAAAVQGAQADGAQAATVASALTSALNAYGVGAEHSAEYTNTLVAAAGQGKMTMEDLSSAVSNVLPAASKAGISLQEVTGAMATMTATGTDASSAATYLRQTIGQLSNPSTKAKKEMEALGINSIQLAQNMGKNGLGAALNELTDHINSHLGPAGTVLIDKLKGGKISVQDFQTALGTLPQTEQTQIGALADMVGGVKSMQAALQLTGPGAKKFADNVTVIKDKVKDAGDKIEGYDKYQETFNAKLGDAKGAFEALSVKIGSAFLPIATQAMKVVGDFAKWLGDNIGWAYALAAAVGIVLTGAIAAFVVKSVKGLADVTTALVKGSAKFTVWIAQKLFGYSTVATAAEVEAGAEEGANVKRSAGLIRNVAKGAWWVATKTGHFIAVSAAAAAQAAVVVAKWAWEATTTAAGAVASGAKWLATKLAQYAAVAAGAVAQAAIASAAWIAENAVAIAATGGIILVIGLIVAAVLWCIDHWEDIKRVAGEVWDWVEKRFEDAKNWIGDRINDIVNFFKGIGRIIQIAEEAFQKANDAIGQKIGEAIDWVKALPGRILGALGDLGNLLWDSGKNLVIGLWNGLVSMGSWLMGKITGWIKSVIPGPIASALGIASPSKVAHDLATHVPEGLAGGMIANARMVTDASKALAGEAVSAFSGSGPNGSLALNAASNGGYALSTAAATGVAALGGPGGGLTSGNGAQGNSGPVTVIHVHGTIVDPQGLFDAVQKGSTRYNGRNVNNGLATSRV